MKVARAMEVFSLDIEQVWNIITNNEDYTWRSDLSKLVVVDDKKFVEYTKKGFSTTFTITKKDPFQYYEFDLGNENMKGHWTGILKSISPTETQFEMIEEVEVIKPVMKVVSFFFFPLKSMQERYIKDLKKKVEEVKNGQKKTRKMDRW